MAEVKYEVVKNEATTNVTVFLTISMLCSLLTSWLGGFLLDYMTTQQIFLTSAAVPIFILGAALLIPEDIHSNRLEKAHRVRHGVSTWD